LDRLYARLRLHARKAISLSSQYCEHLISFRKNRKPAFFRTTNSSANDSNLGLYVKKYFRAPSVDSLKICGRENCSEVAFSRHAPPEKGNNMKLHRGLSVLAVGFLLLGVTAVFSVPSTAQIGLGISVRIGPPALPVYEQPVCPGGGSLWTPGYWGWDDDGGYYWVPGTWVEAPQPGLLWTPGYWGWNDGAYAWSGGYWGPTVGFYGGVNYGFGFYGAGFGGGEWRGGTFFYNSAVMNVGTTNITNVYVNRTVIVNNTSHVAFNGGQGGIQVRPTAEQEAYMHQTHTPPVASQRQQEHAASQNRALFASTNHGRPAVAATARPGEFSGHGVVAARAAGGTYHAPTMSPKAARASSPAAGGDRGAEGRPAESRPAEGRPAENRPAENHPAPAAREENRPAASSRATSPTYAAAPHNNVAHPAPTHPSEARPSESHAEKTVPKAAPRTSEPRESAPKASTKPASAPKPAREPKPAKESEPKATAPKPSEPKATTHKESAPKATAKPASEPKPAKESEPKPAKAAAPRPAKASTPKPAKAAQPKPQSAPKASEPKASSKPAPAPKAAPAKHEAPPKEEHKG
jgi:WXXGXW repeat (2 copies)